MPTNGLPRKTQFLGCKTTHQKRKKFKTLNGVNAITTKQYDGRTNPNNNGIPQRYHQGIRYPRQSNRRCPAGTMDRNAGKQQPDSAPTTMAKSREKTYIPQ